MNRMTETKLTVAEIKTLRCVARQIVKGSKGREQCTGKYFHRNGDNSCCAIGACLIAIGAPEINSLVLTDYLPLKDWPEINYPEGAEAWDRWNDAIYGDDRIKKPMQLVDVIMQLNDKGGWSFEQIAAYLRTVAKKGIVTSISA